MEDAEVVEDAPLDFGGEREDEPAGAPVRSHRGPDGDEAPRSRRRRRQPAAEDDAELEEDDDDEDDDANERPLPERIGAGADPWYYDGIAFCAVVVLLLGIAGFGVGMHLLVRGPGKNVSQEARDLYGVVVIVSSTCSLLGGVLVSATLLLLADVGRSLRKLVRQGGGAS